MTTYKIIRFYRETGKKITINKGLSLEQAQNHCSKESTHKIDKNGIVVYFDGYTMED
jgi:hypothetical protein